MAKLGEEREHNLSELNQKRVQHVTTLQQMGKYFQLSFYFLWNDLKDSEIVISLYRIVILILIFLSDKHYQSYYHFYMSLNYLLPFLKWNNTIYLLYCVMWLPAIKFLIVKITYRLTFKRRSFQYMVILHLTFVISLKTPII